jgi:hypothetical protein
MSDFMAPPLRTLIGAASAAVPALDGTAIPPAVLKTIQLWRTDSAGRRAQQNPSLSDRLNTQ